MVAGLATCGTVPAVRFLISSRKILIFVCSGALVLAVTPASADGTYQRTKDGRTLVWNDDPKPGDAATWSGKRDRDGYASGFGTLTWYSRRQSGAESKETVFAAFFGNMIRGKLDGPVNGHSKGVTNHAIFSQGKRTSRWAGGPVPSWRVPDDLPQSEAEPIKVARAEPSRSGEFTPPPPSYASKRSERPVPDYNALQKPEGNRSEDVPGEGPAGGSPAAGAPPPPGVADGEKPKLEIDESLKSLTGPPPSLGAVSPENPAPKDGANVGAGPRLGKEDAIGAADTAARNKGYVIDQYQRAEPEFDAVDRTWSILYEPKAENAKHFTVAIDDKTGRTAVVGRR